MLAFQLAGMFDECQSSVEDGKETVVPIRRDWDQRRTALWRREGVSPFFKKYNDLNDWMGSKGWKICLGVNKAGAMSETIWGFEGEGFEGEEDMPATCRCVYLHVCTCEG